MKLLPKQWKDLSFWGVFFLCLLSSHFSNGQDTLRIFYTSGEHKLYPNSKMDINGFIFSHELKYVDSICLNGYTDSTGQTKKNQKLSERRVGTVKKYLYRIGISDSVPVFTLAKGEESDNENPNLENHRRVELILYFTKSYIPPAEEEEKPSGNFVNSNCYLSALDVMSKSNLTYFMKGNTKYVKLEMEANLMNQSQRYYSLTARNRYPKLVKWEVETTGYWWWKRPRYVANIKAKDYEKYGVVVLHETDTSNREPCTICGTDPQNDWFLNAQLMPDSYILQNMLIKKRIFPSRIEIAVPKEYVSIGRGYYLDSLTSIPLYWTIKRTRNAAPFYYAEIPKALFNPSDFQVYSYRRVCAEAREVFQPNPADTVGRGRCLIDFGNFVDFSLGLEVSYRHFIRDEGLYGVYFQLPWKQFLLQTTLGYSSKNRAFGSFQADYHFLGTSLFGEFRMHSNPVLVQENQRLFTTYAGTAFSGLSTHGSAQIINEYHLGVSFWNKTVGFGLDSFFLQAGVFFDLSADSGDEIFSLRTGFRLRIH